VHYLSQALIAHYRHGQDDLLLHYGETALARVWQAMRFSWSMTTLLHRFPDQSPFDRRMQRAEMDQLLVSPDARRILAENYTGLPY
jgi:p-hydroxybenzoate 3-monooxygenase